MLNLEEIRRKNLLTYKAERIYKMKKTRMLRTFSKGQSEYEEVVREYDLDKITTKEFETICQQAERVEFYNETVFA